MTEALTFALLLATIVWIGGAIVGTLLGQQLRRSAGSTALGHYCTAFATVAGPLFGGSSLVVLGTGLALVLRDGGPQFADGWVLGAFACWLVGTVLGASGVGMNWNRVGRELAGGATLEQVQPRVSRAIALTSLDQAILLVGVLLVVVRPGA